MDTTICRQTQLSYCLMPQWAHIDQSDWCGAERFFNTFELKMLERSFLSDTHAVYLLCIPKDTQISCNPIVRYTS